MPVLAAVRHAAIRVRSFFPADLEKAVGDAPAQYGSASPNGPESALQATNASSASPSYIGSKSPGRSSAGGPRSSVLPRTLNHERHDGNRSSKSRPTGERTSVNDQRSIDHLKPIKEHLELLISPLQLQPVTGHRSVDFTLEEVKAHLDAVERVAASMIEAAQHLSEVFDLDPESSSGAESRTVKILPPPVRRAVADSWGSTWLADFGAGFEWRASSRW